MSDTPPFDSFLKWKMGIESPSLAYAAKTVTRNVILAVDIPYLLLKLWHDFIKTQKNHGDSTCDNGEPSCSTSSNLHMHEAHIKLYLMLICLNLLFWEMHLQSAVMKKLDWKLMNLYGKFVERYKVNIQRPKEQGGKRNSTQNRRDFIYLKDRLSQ